MNTVSVIKPEAVFKTWGIASSIDIYDCDPSTIRVLAQGYFGGSFSSLNVALRH